MEDTFGVEEEFMIVDARTLAPVSIADSAIADLRSAVTGGAVTAEFLPSQVEFSTGICRTPGEAGRDIGGFRRLLSAWAARHGVLVTPAGTSFTMMDTAPRLRGERYPRIARDIGMLTIEHLVNGMHVHVGISDPEEGVRVLNGLRPWLPLLLALSANSPFWAGADTGHSSWRAIQTRRWTTYGIPPHVGDFAEYSALRERLRGVGATQEYCETSWSVRLSEHFPTVEVRVCDVQLTPQAALAVALIVRSLAHVCADPAYEPIAVRSHVLDAELWHAARHGVAGTVYVPDGDAHVTASDALHALWRRIAPVARSQGSTRIITAHLRALAAGRTPVHEQRAALEEGGPRRLAEVYRESLTGRSGARTAAQDPEQEGDQGEHAHDQGHPQ